MKRLIIPAIVCLSTIKFLKSRKNIIHKSGLHLIIFITSNIGISSVTFAQQSYQQPNNLQNFYTQCQQGNQYACQQHKLMIQGNQERQMGQIQRQYEMDNDRDYINEMNREENCRSFSYDFDTSYCDRDNPY